MHGRRSRAAPAPARVRRPRRRRVSTTSALPRSTARARSRRQSPSAGGRARRRRRRPRNTVAIVTGGSARSAVAAASSCGGVRIGERSTMRAGRGASSSMKLPCAAEQRRQRHDRRFAVRIDRRVGDLRKALAEEIGEEPRRAPTARPAARRRPSSRPPRGRRRPSASAAARLPRASSRTRPAVAASDSGSRFADLDRSRRTCGASRVATASGQR